MYSLTYKKNKDENSVPIVRDGMRTLYVTDQQTEKEDDEKNFLRTLDWDKLFRDFELGPMNVRERAKATSNLMRHIVKRVPPIEEDLAQIYNFIVEEIRNGNIKKQILSDNTLEILPSPTDDQNMRCTRVAAMSGAGKSYWTAAFCRNYHAMFPERDIYLFSFIQDPDPAFEGLPIIKIPLTRQLIEQDPEPDLRQFEKSLVIFDDAEASVDKVLLKYLEALKDRILCMGRKLKISCIECTHLTTNFKQSRVSLLESGIFVIFPNGSSRRNLHYLLSNYTNLSPDKISHVLNIRGSRWVAVKKSMPSMIITEHSVELI
jgi:hypothetical protein